MEQQKIGQFLKELRKEKDITQAQLAEILGVTNRSVSRWENGVNMPDLDLIIQIAEFYSLEVGEILDGERKNDNMDKKTEETILKVADYSNQEKMIFTKRMHYIFIAGVIAFILYMFLEIKGLADAGIYEDIASFALGLVFGILIVGVLFTSRYMTKIKAFKMRLLNRNKVYEQQMLFYQKNILVHSNIFAII